MGSPGESHEPQTVHERVLGLIREQESLYAALDGLSRSQREAIDAGDADGLLGILTERQGVVDAIVGVSERLQPFQDRWSDVVDEMPEAFRDEVRGRVDRLAELMRSVSERDEADRSALQERRELLSGSAMKARRTSGAVRAYGGSAPARGPRYEDRRA